MALQKHIKLFLFLLAVCAITAFFVFQPSGTKAAENLLRKGCVAIQAKDIDRLMPLISLSYKDSLGMTYGALRGAFSWVFSQFSDITVDCRIMNISIAKDMVTTDLLVWTRGHGMQGPALQDIVGTRDDFEPVSILFKKDFIKWKVVGSRWPRRKAGMPEFNSNSGF
jgi:hypothetical protein